jgi:hypothetical protein
METLLVIAIIVTAVAIVIQAGVLIAMYLMSRRMVDNVNGLVTEAHQLMAPMERIATNFRAASEDVVELGKNARQELVRIESIMKETQTAVRDEIQDLRDRVNSTVDDLQHTVMRPVREWSAIATGITVGIRSFFNRRATTAEGPVVGTDIGQTPAA